MISVKHVIKQYGSLQVLDNVSVEIQDNEFVSIVGSSGAGKSTLLHIMGSLDHPDSGTVTYDGQEIFALNNKKIARFRNEHIGFIFQFHHLLPEFSAIENVQIPAMIAGRSKAAAAQKANELLHELGIGHIAHKKPAEISGGEAQRVAIARALINSPKVLLADEPTGNLDSANAELVFDLLLQLRKKMQLSLVMVTHNNDLAAQSDRIIQMKDGKIVH